MKHILTYEWRLFLRSKGALAAWLLMLLIGVYALYYGRSFHQVQQVTLTKIDTAYQNRILTQVQNFSADTATKEGKSTFNNARDPFMNEWATRPMAWKQPSGLQALSIGQSDNQPFYYNLWVYNNVYNTKQVELRNPDKLLSGNFDLAFVIIYLLPLLVIAFSYHVASQDDEQGITSLLLTQGVSQQAVIIHRLLFRSLVMLALVLFLTTTGMLLNRVPVGTAIGWIGVSLLYTLVWFAIVYAFVSFRNASSVTALKLVSAWIILLILIPSLINGFQQPDEKGKLEIADASREYPGQIWSMEKKKLADTLFQVKPEWKDLFDKSKRDTSELRSTAYIFFLGQKMNSVGFRIDSIAIAGQQQIERLNFINPVYAAQMLFNKLAGTELNSYVDFRKAVSDYQLQRFDRITVKRLPGEKLRVDEYEAYPVFQQSRAGLGLQQWLLGLSPLLLFLFIFILIGNYSWKKSKNVK